MQKLWSNIFFLSGFSFSVTDDSQETGEGRGPYSFLCTIPFTYEHLGAYLQFCIWDDYLSFSNVAHVITTLLRMRYIHPWKLEWFNIFLGLLVRFIQIVLKIFEFASTIVSVTATETTKQVDETNLDNCNTL